MFSWLGLLEASAVGGTCILLFFLISLLQGERYLAGYKKIIWLLIALRMCIPVSISLFPKPVNVQVPVYVLREDRKTAVWGSETEGMLPGEEGFAAGVSAPEGQGGDVEGRLITRGRVTSQNLLVLLWGAGSVSVLFFSVLSHVLFRRKMFQRSKRCAKERIVNTTAEIAGEIGLKRIPQVRLMKDCQTGPFTVGILRNTIFLPDTDYQEADLRYIIRHELIHCAGGDTQIKALLVIVNAIHWFNPLAWFMKALAD